MKVIYYLYSYNSQLPGVNSKVLEKINALISEGINLKCILLYKDEAQNLDMFSNDIFEKHYFNPKQQNIRILKSRYFSPLVSFLNNLRATKLLYNQILKNKPIDFLITRYGTSDYSTFWLVKKLNCKIIFESNTNEIEQLKIRYKGLFNSPLWITYDYLSELFFGPCVLRKAAAVVCVTKEIAKYQRERIGMINTPFPKVTTISNGINVNNYPVSESKFNNGVINAIMILGVDSEWNGLDKIVNAIISNTCEFNLYIVGNIKDKVEHQNIYYVGELDQMEISRLIQSKMINAGIGTLALERKGIKEAAPLKVREYLSRGLPIVYSYNDTDIDSNDEFVKKCCIKLKYGTQQIDLDEICKNLKKITKEMDYNLRIREFALNNVDVSSKAKQYKNLIDELRLSVK